MLGTKFQRTVGTGAFDSVKDLVLEVPRLPLTYRSALSPTSSPVARAAFLRLTTLMLEPAARFNFFRTATDDNIASRCLGYYSKPRPIPQPPVFSNTR